MFNNRLSRAFDKLLDQTVLFSYTNVGYGLRRGMWDAADLEADMSGKRCIVTGANSGLGFATAKRLAELGASVTLAGAKLRQRAGGSGCDHRTNKEPEPSILKWLT